MGRFGPDLPPALRQVAVIVQGVAFWTAVVLPLVWLSLLLVPLPSGADLWVIGTLIVLNAAALVVGHGYSGTSGRTSEG